MRWKKYVYSGNASSTSCVHKYGRYLPIISLLFFSSRYCSVKRNLACNIGIVLKPTHHTGTSGPRPYYPTVSLLYLHQVAVNTLHLKAKGLFHSCCQLAELHGLQRCYSKLNQLKIYTVVLA